MTAEHREVILMNMPELEDKVFTLKINGNIKDPYLGGDDVYEDTFKEILREIGRISENG